MKLRIVQLGMVGIAAVACGAAGTALGQYSTGFESSDNINASTGGTVLTGQDNYYIPQGTQSVDYLAYIYQGNALGINQNPNGGEQFVAVEGPGGGTYGRAQRDMNWGTGLATVEYDVCCIYTQQPPGGNNLGSFSVQPYPGSASYIHLFSWVDINNPVAWRAFYMAYTANGVAHSQPGMSPGPEWENLELNHWYNFETDIDFTQNRITQVRVTDLNTNQSASFDPPDWYLEGGSGGPPMAPTGFRMFSGGGVLGNVTAFDNMEIRIEDVNNFTLDVTNSCPNSGPATLTASGGTGGNVAFIYSNRTGNFMIPNNYPTCPGTVLGLGGTPTLIGTARGNPAVFRANAPRAACNRVFLQALDVGDCNTSNVVRFE